MHFYKWRSYEWKLMIVQFKISTLFFSTTTLSELHYSEDAVWISVIFALLVFIHFLFYMYHIELCSAILHSYCSTCCKLIFDVSIISWLQNIGIWPVLPSGKLGERKLVEETNVWFKIIIIFFLIMQKLVTEKSSVMLFWK